MTIITYAHLCTLVVLSGGRHHPSALDALIAAMKSGESHAPTKDALFYWTMINRAMLSTSPSLTAIWQDEKLATLEALAAAKDEALTALATERDRIQRMSHEEAVNALITHKNIVGRMNTVNAVVGNTMLAFR